MLSINLRLAWEAIKTYRLRSFLTMLGVIVGVAAVITTVSIGQGVKDQVGGEVNRFGNDLLIVQPGVESEKNQLLSIDSLNTNFMTNLSNYDYTALKQEQSLKYVAPLTAVSGVVSYNDEVSKKSQVIGTTPDLKDLLNIELEFGQFLKEENLNNKFAVIGSELSSKFFAEAIPIGRSLGFQGDKYIIVGVMENFEGGAFAPGINYDNAVFIPQQAAIDHIGENAPIYRILAKPTDDQTLGSVIPKVESIVEESHGGQKDFSVLTQADAVEVSNNILSILTNLVSIIAVVALVIGGVGIMNVMLVSVTERTHEIGIRKAVGATNKQIMSQFLIEAILLSVVGSIVGLIIAGAINVLLRIFTDITPSVSPVIYFAAIVVAIGTGIIFGVTPALKAARKDPISALRNQ